MVGAPMPPSSDPLTQSFLDAVATHAAGFEWDATRAGVDVRCTTAVAGGANRARLKAFLPKPGTLVVFLYKDSNVPFSDDRFSYGALTVKSVPKDAADYVAVLDYAASGFHPERRPDCAKRTVPFTVPK